MTKRMLIDATHAEETRVVVLDGNRLEDFDVETSTKKQLKGNIYLAKIVRVEPSLQAAFVEYGGSRHGFLAFGEIHPDYYQIPVADRQRLLQQQEQEAREAEAAEDEAAAAEEAAGGADAPPAFAPEPREAAVADDDFVAEAGNAEPDSGSGRPIAESPEEQQPDATAEDGPASGAEPAQPLGVNTDSVTGTEVFEPGGYDAAPVAALAELGLTVAADGEITGDPQAMAELAHAIEPDQPEPDQPEPDQPEPDQPEPDQPEPDQTEPEFGQVPAGPPPETLGGESDAGEDRERRAPSARHLRSYKIQEVIRRRQIMLVQVVKEERGGKGAALTTYISLAGRFCVLMPNSPRGGGVSRKITSAADRRRLKEVTAELDLPPGMGLIVRTAGAARPKPEIKRDCEYLLNLWDDIRDSTLKSVAPAAIYEEASLIKRAIRDVYSRDVDEVVVDGEAAWHAAREQMRLLMPSHAHKVQLWQASEPLFAQVEPQLDAMLSPTVQLKSGGYLVINQTEALVAIDVNSGRSTRERGIEETALRTNLEAAEEVARQLRLRDLAGLIVIDFIDMEARRNNAAVERKLKDALKNDRARIQLGSISHFGLMEMSRQRLRPSLTETNFVQCPACGGAGHVRSTEGSAIHVLRAIEEEGTKRRSAEIMVHVAGPIAMYLLNYKRDRLREIETRYGMTVLFTPDPALLPPALKIDKLRAYGAGEAPPVGQRTQPMVAAVAYEPVEDAADLDDAGDAEEETAVAVAAADRAPEPAGPPGETAAEGSARRRRRRRRRGGRRDEAVADGAAVSSALAEPGAEQPDLPDAEDPLTPEMPAAASAQDPGSDPVGEAEAERSGQRRRGRRGGRRRFRDEPAEAAIDTAAPLPTPAPMPVAAPIYAGPTPANPFGGGSYDIFDAIEQATAAMDDDLLVSSPPAPLPKPPPEGGADAAPEEQADAPRPADPEPAAAAEPPVLEAVPVESGLIVKPAAQPAPKVRAPRRSRAKVPPPAPEPAPVPETAPEAFEPAPEAPPAADPAADPAGEPLVKPVLVDTAPEAPKRGWWRR